AVVGRPRIEKVRAGFSVTRIGFALAEPEWTHRSFSEASRWRTLLARSQEPSPRSSFAGINRVHDYGLIRRLSRSWSQTMSRVFGCKGEMVQHVIGCFMVGCRVAVGLRGE